MFKSIAIEINSATEAADSYLRISASVALYSFLMQLFQFLRKSQPSIEVVIYPCSKSNIATKYCV